MSNLFSPAVWLDSQDFDFELCSNEEMGHIDIAAWLNLTEETLSLVCHEISVSLSQELASSNLNALVDNSSRSLPDQAPEPLRSASSPITSCPAKYELKPHLIDYGYPISSAIAHTVLFSPNGNLLAKASTNIIQLWDLVIQTMLPPLPNPQDEDDKPCSMNLSHSSKLLASGSSGGSINLWDLSTSSLLHRFGHTGPIRCLTFSHDDRYLVSSSADKSVKVWDLVLAREHLTVPHVKVAVTAAGISPDNRKLVTGSVDGCVRIYSFVSGTQTHCLRAGSRPISSLAFTSHRLGLFATGGGDGMVRLWDLGREKKMLVSTLREHHDAVTNVAFSGDGKYLVSVGVNDEVGLWNVAALETGARRDPAWDEYQVCAMVGIGSDGGGSRYLCCWVHRDG